MPARTRRLITLGIPGVCSAVGLAAIGHHHVWWGPEPPRDPNALVLRIRFVKGMASPFDRPVPDISVYGDGRMLITATDLTETPARQVIRDQRLTGPAYRRIYRDTRLAGLGTSRTFRSEHQVIDGGPTVLTLLANGRRHISTVNAGTGGIRVRMIERLTERLRSVPRDDLTAPPATYRPTRTAIVAWRHPENPPTGTPETGTRIRPWPLHPLTAGTQPTCTLATGPNAETATRLAATTPTAQWRSGPSLYTVTFRPLLPDEPNCTAATP